MGLYVDDSESEEESESASEDEDEEDDDDERFRKGRKHSTPYEYHQSATTPLEVAGMRVEWLVLWGLPAA